MVFIKTDAILLSHTAFLNIDGLKSYLKKDNPVCLDLEYYQPKNEFKKRYIWVISPFFKWCSKFFSDKRIHNTFLIRGEKNRKQQDSLKTKLNLSIYVWKGSCFPIQNHILKNLKSTHFLLSRILLNELHSKMQTNHL